MDHSGLGISFQRTNNGQLSLPETRRRVHVAISNSDDRVQFKKINRYSAVAFDFCNFNVPSVNRNLHMPAADEPKQMKSTPFLLLVGAFVTLIHIQSVCMRAVFITVNAQ